MSSLRARRSDDDGAKTSSGASMVEVAIVVGRADSSDAADILATVDIEAFGYSRTSINGMSFSKIELTALGVKCALHNASSFELMFSHSCVIS